MASIPILGSQTKVGAGVYPSPYSEFSTNSFFNPTVYVFPDGSTKISINGVFKVPANYASGASIIASWTSQATSGDVEWDFDYRAVASGESLDQATAQESVNQNTAAPASTDLRVDTTLTVTDGNFSAGDLVEFILSRDLTDAGDTMADNALLFNAHFDYTAS